RRRVPVHAVHLLQAEQRRGAPAGPGDDRRVARGDVDRPVQRARRLGGRHLVLRHDARNVVHARRSDPDHLPRDPGHHPGDIGGGTYSELIWAIGIVLILQITLSFTRWGIYTVAVGGNRLGAAEAGVRTKVVLTRNFMMCALLAGFVGILEAVRAVTTTPDPSGSNDILFQAISAAVVGGTLLRGGSGTVVGAFIGALFLGILRDGLNIKGVSANYFLFYL